MPVEKPLNRVWLVDCSTNPLREGWHENQQVTVIRQVGGKFEVRALDREDEIDLAPTCLDGGWVFALPGGEEVHESNPAALAALKRGVERQLLLDIPDVTRSAAVWFRVLKRKGVDVEVPVEF